MKTNWSEGFAKTYHDEVMLEQNNIIGPLITSLLKKSKGKNLVDIGCGSGRYSRIAAELGKIVTGVDRNKDQLKIARNKEGHQNLGINYLLSDIKKIHKLKPNSQDIALLNFVIIEMPSKNFVKSIINESFRILKKDGILEIGEVHPHSLNRKGFVNETFLKRKRDSYYTNAAPLFSAGRMENGKKLVFKADYHYTLEFLVNTIIESGFSITSIKEKSHKEKWPTHIFIVAKKV